MTKTLTFALLHFGIAFGITDLLTGDLLLGGLVALIEPSVNTLAFYFHEQFWRRWEQRKQQSTQYHRAGAGLVIASGPEH